MEKGLIGAFIVFTVLWIIQIIRRDAGVVDIGWTAGVGAMAVYAASVGEGWLPRRIMLGAMGGIWSLRLVIYILRDQILVEMEDSRYQRLRSHWEKNARANPDWIQKYIFPGGMLPSLTALSNAMTRYSSFTVEHLSNIGVHYAETLRRWRSAFGMNREKLLALGYDETFQRKWIYYLCYCEAGFQTRFTNDLHLALTRPAELD